MGDEVKDWGPDGARDAEAEEIQIFAPHLFRWEGPKAKFLLFGTVQGTLVVTTSRLLFLTAGGSGLTSQFSALGEQLSGGMRLADVDLGLLGNAESIDMPLDQITRIEVIRRWDFASYLTLAGTDTDGEEVCVAFMPKMGFTAKHLRKLAATARGDEGA